DEVVMAAANARELRQPGADRLAAEPPLGNRARLIVELDGVELPELAEHFEVVAGAAADLENARVGGGHRFPPDKLRKHRAARAIPPVPLIELGHLLVDDALHQPNTHCRL